MNALWIKVQRALDNAFTKQIVVFVKWCWSRWHPLPTTVKVGITSLLLGFGLLGNAHYQGLAVAPGELHMGDVGRILYVHVPTAWIALLSFLAAFIAAVGALWTSKFGWDALVGACSEVGLVLTGMLLFQGMVWAKPTWGTYWVWDPRLTSSAMMFVMFGVVLLLRKIISDPERRMTVSSVTAILAFVDVPIVYFSVRWWKAGLHQDFSSPDTVSETMHLPLRMAAFGVLFIAIGLVLFRWKTIRRELEIETDVPDLPPVPTPLQLDEQEGQS